ncbi:hypothetical protein [Acinetobacter sp.]|uniref:hypothetical protein n=1 Tax=Acinetobacter sp. TaxID=472 RepID=UPI00289CCCF9|nr:hypothetical protein [Acinetobacter sp.]
MLDAYEKLFELIDKEIFFKSSINNIIYIQDTEIDRRWNNLKQDLLNNTPMTIRSYGRNGINSNLFQELYKILFNHQNIHIDRTNTDIPAKILKDLTPYCKKTKRVDGPKIRIMNYQISHLFGRTKNPLLFTAPWNIAYIPKYLDPFTGHESQGTTSREFKQIFNRLLSEKFKEYIQDYNQFIAVYAHQEKLNDAIEQVRRNINKPLEEKTLINFKKDVYLQWSKIE